MSLYRALADNMAEYWISQKLYWNDKRAEHFDAFTIKPIIAILYELADEEDAFDEVCREAEESARGYYEY